MIGILFDVKESKTQEKRNEERKKGNESVWITAYEIMRSCQLWVKERNAGGRKKEGHEISVRVQGSVKEEKAGAR